MRIKQTICRLLCLAVCLAIGFILGHDWPYYSPPNDFGVYCNSKEYKYVITKDITRRCKQISILRDNMVVYHTAGYIGRGYHEGMYKVEVYWGKLTNNLYVVDGRGTFDVYTYDRNQETWNGPFALNFPAFSDSNVFELRKYYDYELCPGFEYTVDSDLIPVPEIDQNDIPDSITNRASR